MTFIPQAPLDPSALYDVCIIGGGINGTGIARDAAGRGLKVLLVEQGDLAQATSSASTKIIHGGLRYLEYYDFKLVHESLQERDLLMSLAPHLIRPLTFILPHNHSIRPYWMVRAGLYLYDLLGAGKTLPRSRGLDLRSHPAGAPLQENLSQGFSYSDCWGDDSRLVALNALGAAEKGARIETRTRCTGLAAAEDGWVIDLHHIQNETTVQMRARMVVNAAGPWVRTLLDSSELSDMETPAIRLVQGSHIIVPRIYDGDQAYMLQQPDGRIVFAIPYEGLYTQIGTTETAYRGDPLKAEITAQEMDYLLTASNQSFLKQTTMADIVRSFSGVRPLFDDNHRDAKAVTRDYRLHLSEHQGQALLSVFGGKITTYRKLSEHATDQLMAHLGREGSVWTDKEPLPGGDIQDFSKYLDQQIAARPDVDPKVVTRYTHAYGTRMNEILKDGLGQHYGDGVYECELRYLITHEFACSAQDILWRRSKLGLHITDDTRISVERAMADMIKERK